MIVAIVGPTGIGKTRLSIALAHIYNAIIINCDAMQLYKQMNIGTAKIKEEEKEGITHYLFDICEVSDDFTVFDYQQKARKLIEENKDKNIILVGGTGFYLKALLYNYVFPVENKRDNYDDLSNEKLYELALKKDVNMNIPLNDRQRLIRFLNKDNLNNELCYPLYDFKIIGLTTKREILYTKINERVDEMLNLGLIDEVRKLYAKYPTAKQLKKAIGYKELLPYIDNEISLEEATNNIKKNSRHYAKRQYTWFKHQFPVSWISVDFANFNNTIKEAKEIIDSWSTHE